MAKRAQRVKRTESPRELVPEQDHGRQRTIYRVGNSWVVPVPLWVRALLERSDGGSVYWHEFRPGEAVLSVEPTRAGGRPTGAAAERRIARLMRENLRLRRRLRARPIGVLGEQISQVMHQAIRVGLPIEATMKETLDLVRELHARMPLARRAAPPPARRRALRAQVLPGPDTYDAPAASELPAEVEAPS